jgi:hypothetical protein
VVDSPIGETCDDGDELDGDTCPSDCGAPILTGLPGLEGGCGCDDDAQRHASRGKFPIVAAYSGFVTRLLASLVLVLGLASCGDSSDAASSTSSRPDSASEPAARGPVERAPTGDVPATPPAAAPAPAPERFVLSWRRTSGAFFRDQITVRDDGQLTWVAQVVVGNTGSMHAITLQLTEAEVRSVRSAIDAAGFFSLPAEPGPSGVDDGEQLVVRMRLGDREHRVHGQEPMPPGLERLRAAVDALLTDARRAQLAAAREPDPEDFDPSLVAQ